VFCGFTAVRIRAVLKRIRAGSSGQDLIEYALLGAFIALMVAGVATFGAAIGDWYGAAAGVAQLGSSAIPGSDTSSSPASSGKSHCSPTGSDHSHGKCN